MLTSLQGLCVLSYIIPKSNHNYLEYLGILNINIVVWFISVVIYFSSMFLFCVKKRGHPIYQKTFDTEKRLTNVVYYIRNHSWHPSKWALSDLDNLREFFMYQTYVLGNRVNDTTARLEIALIMWLNYSQELFWIGNPVKYFCNRPALKRQTIPGSDFNKKN